MSAFLLYSKNSLPEPLLPLLKMDSGMNLPKEDLNLVIQWGTGQLSAEDKAVHVLNGAEGLANAEAKDTMNEILRMTGIPVAEESGTALKMTTIRRYFAHIFQQDELALYRSKGKKVWLSDQLSAHSSDAYEEIEMNRNIKEIKNVLRYAVRSVYALGLDFGGVLIGVELNGKIRVLDVTPTPRITAALAVKYADVFHHYQEQYAKIPPKPVMMGADPEFVLRNHQNGKIVPASRFFSKKGSVGCDFIWMRSDQTRRQLPLAELRPRPARDPRQLAVNLYRTMLLAEKKISSESIEWLAGGMPLKGYPIGGHIHFSQTWLNSSFLRSLDSYLALPLMLIENNHSLSRRPKYGFLGDFRRQFHGGFEYRTLPSWLVSPRVTKGVFAAAKLIAECYPQLTRYPTLNPEVQRAFYHGDKKTILLIVKELWKDLEELEDYSKYQQYLVPFRNLVMEEKEWNEFQDIRPAWRIPPFSAKKN